MIEGLPFEACVNVTVIVVSVFVETPVSTGARGGDVETGVPDLEFELTLDPTEFIARITTGYVVPFVNPAIVNGLVVVDAETNVVPLSTEYS